MGRPVVALPLFLSSGSACQFGSFCPPSFNFTFSPFITLFHSPDRPGWSLWLVPPSPLLSPLLTPPHTFTIYARLVIVAGPALLPLPLHRFPPTLPSSYSSLTSYTRTYHIHSLPSGPGCHRGRSRLTFCTFSLLSPPILTPPCSHRGPACHCGRSRHFSLCLYTPVNSFPFPPSCAHLNPDFPPQCPHQKGPASHCGWSRLFLTPYSSLPPLPTPLPYSFFPVLLRSFALTFLMLLSCLFPRLRTGALTN